MNSIEKLFKKIIAVFCVVLFAPVGLAMAAQAWTQLSPAGGPPRLYMYQHTAVSDVATNRLIVYGRNASWGNEVWTLSNANGLGGMPTWTQLATVGGPPAGRGNHAAVYDSVNNRMIIFGGCGGGCYPIYNDVWVLSNANGLGGTPTWTQLPIIGSAPAPRHAVAVGYDPSTNRMIIFGGQNGGGFGGSTYSDAWVLSNANGLGGAPAWTQLSTIGGIPPGQYGPSFVFDASNNRLVVAGGAAQGSGVATNAAWVLSNANGLGGTPTWTNLVAEGAAGSPPPNGFLAAAYIPAENRMLQWDGSSIWMLSNANGLGGISSWSQTPVSGVLPTGSATSNAMAYDPNSDRALEVIIAGIAPNNFNEPWVLTGASGNHPPIANAGVDQNIYLGQTAILDGSASSDPDRDPLSYSWTLDTAPVGSAAILSGATTVNPSLTPDVAGTYHISLVVSDGQVRSAASTVTINVSLNLPPVAAATGNPVLGYAPLQVTFDAGASRDPENSALTYSWNFGDPVSGANNTSTIVNPIHSYTTVGNYTAVVTVMDNFGKTDQASVAITITAPNLPPVVSPTATPSNGVAPLSVQFAANATDVNLSDVLSYSWNFGDGSAASTLANPQHTYATGTYTAVVTVSDGVNAPVSANLTISVGSALTINVTEAKVERGEKGKVEGKISMQADFNFAGMPWGGDMILVKFDGITLLNVPFSSFRQESAGKFEYETRTQDAEINFNRRTIKVSSHKILTGLVDNSNGIDVVISFGVATATDNFVMRNHKGDKGDHDSELSHKK